MNRCLTVVAVVAAMALVAPSLGTAQDLQESRTAPISVETDAQTVPAGSSIAFRGRTVAVDAKKPVVLTITWLRSLRPGATATPPKPAVVQAPCAADGGFSAVYQTEREGVYRVDASSPDGTGKASTEFKAVPFADWAAAEGQSLSEALDATSNLLDALEHVVAAQPASPAQREFETKLQPLKRALAARAPAARNVQEAVAFYARIPSEVAATSPAFDPLVRGIKEFRRDSAGLAPPMKAATAEAKARNRVCDDLLKVEEGFKLLSTMINFVGKLHETILAFSIDFATSVAASKAPSSCTDACKFAFTEAVKQRDWIKTGAEQARTRAVDFKAFAGGLPGFLADVGAFASRSLFDRYCERFEGPVDGNMNVEYLKDGEVWWRYTAKIKGIMTLAYRKGSDASQPIPMSGHVFGTGTEFAVAENALRVLKRDVLAGAVLLGGTIPPAGFPFLDFAGAVALQTVPTAFFIAVEGELRGNTLRVRLGPTRTDFNKDYTVAKGRYAIIGGYAGSLGSFTTFQVGYDSARGLIEKATDIDSAPIELPVTVGKDTLTATKTFRGQRGQVKAHGEYQLKLVLCNPKC